MIGPRTGLKVGPRTGLAVGLSSDELSSGSSLPPFDGSTTIYRPTTEAHYIAMGWPVPSYRFQLQEASGNVTDDIHGLVATATGAGHTYQVSGADPAGFASKGIRLVDATASMGFSNAAGARWDPTYQCLTSYIEVELNAVPAATRAIYALTGAASAYIAFLGSGVPANQAKIFIQGTGNTFGTAQYNDGKRHPILIEWFPGSFTGGQVLGHTVARYRISTDKEQFSGTWAFVADSTKGIGTGGSASLTCGNVTYFDDITWVGSNAETIGSTTTPKVHLQRRGWTVTGY